MRIVIGSQTYPLPNGVTNSINESVNGFLEAGHQIMLIAPDYGLPQARPEHVVVPGSSFSRNAIKIFGVQGKKELVFSRIAAAEIQRLTEQFRPDAYWMHQVTFAANAFERHVFRSNLPTVLTYHTLLDYYGKVYAGVVGEQAMIFRSAKVANLADAIIAPSQYVRSKLIGWGVETPIEVISTGIEPITQSYSAEELRAKFHIPTDHRVLLFVGRVVREKNIAALLKMLTIVVKTEPKVTLLLIGPGDIEETAAQAKEMGIGDHVVMSGQLPAAETRKCYGGSDVFVFASQSETQGLVIGEAMLADTPVAALVSPIQPEVYPEEVALVAHTESELAQAVLSAWRSPTETKERSIRARQFVEQKFSKKIMIDRQISVFTSLVRQPIGK